MKSKWRRIVASCAASLWVPGLAIAVSVGSVSVRQSGEVGRIDQAFVLAHVQTDVGDPFSAAVAARDVRRLLDTGRFATVHVDVESPQADTLDVVFTIEPKMRLSGRPIVYGVERFSQRRVRNWLDLEEGVLIDDQDAAVAMRRVLAEYHKRHYRAASGSWEFSVVDQRRGLAQLHIWIEEGQRQSIQQVKVDGNETFERKALRRALKRPSPLNPWRWFFARRYEEHELDEISGNVKQFYLDRGHLDVEVAIEQGARKRGGQYAEVRIEEGPVYRIGEVTVLGAERYEADLLEQLAALQVGDPASMGAIEAAADRIQGYYGDRGYLETRVRPLLVPDLQALTVDVQFVVTEGDLVRLRNIWIQGNSRTRDKVIRRELLVHPGEIYNRSRVERSERRLRNLGFFDNVQTGALPVADPAERDLVFNVTEKRTGQFMMGVGFSSVDNLLGFAELSQGNFDLFGWPYFTGGGQKLRLRAQAGSTRQDYELSFTEPWFLNRQLSLGVELYRRERSFSEYDLKRTGASVSLGRALPWASRINLEYQIEKSVITDVSDTNRYFRLDSYDFETGTGTPYFFASEEDRLKSALSLSLVQDVRDNPFIPTRGHRFQLFYTVSGGPMGGDIDMFHTGVRHALYVPLWFGHVISLRTRAEFVDTFGDMDEVPLAERLFAGGGRTIRGYRFRDVGPKVIRPLEGSDRFRHRPFGGLSLFVANAEYTVPVAQAVRIAAFYDAGNVWSDRFTLELDDLATSAGVGLRFDLPGFPIRIDRAWALQKDDRFTSEDLWSIWIGYDF